MTTPRHPRTPKTLLAATLLAAASLLAVPALAQDAPSGGSKKKEVLAVAPTPPAGKSDIPFTPYIVTILLLLIVVGVNFIPSKRGHQD